MRNAARPAAVLLALLSVWMAVPTGCAHVPAPIKDFGVCVEQRVSLQVQGIMADVAAALAGGNFFVALTGIAGKLSYDVVDCAVAEVSARARAQAASAPSDRLSRIQIEHGDAWLAR